MSRSSRDKKLFDDLAALGPSATIVKRTEEAADYLLHKVDHTQYAKGSTLRDYHEARNLAIDKEGEGKPVQSLRRAALYTSPVLRITELPGKVCDKAPLLAAFLKQEQTDYTTAVEQARLNSTRTIERNRKRVAAAHLPHTPHTRSDDPRRQRPRITPPSSLAGVLRAQAGQVVEEKEEEGKEGEEEKEEEEGKEGEEEEEEEESGDDDDDE